MRSEILQDARNFKAESTSRLKAKADAFLLRAKESILVDTDIDYPENFDQITSEKLSTGIYYPVVLGTHKAHTGAFNPLNAANRIRDLAPEGSFQEILLLVAENIDGGQNKAITDNFRSVRPVLEKLHTKTLGIFRHKDIKTLIKDGVSKEEIRRQQDEQTQGVKNAIANKEIIVSLPEASVQSGRKKEGGKRGEINGMIAIQQNSILFLTNLIREAGYEPLLIFVGNTGEDNIYNPNKGKLTISKTKPSKGGITISSKIKGAIRTHPLGRQIVPPILSSIVDYPVPLEDIEMYLASKGKTQGKDIEQYCAERLARLLSPEERGSVYNNLELLPDAPSPDEEIKMRRPESITFKKRGVIFRRKIR